jgi:hypothetical protein
VGNEGCLRIERREVEVAAIFMVRTPNVREHVSGSRPPSSVLLLLFLEQPSQKVVGPALQLVLKSALHRSRDIQRDTGLL